MKHSTRFSPCCIALIGVTMLMSAQTSSVSARERRAEHLPARHETVRRPQPQHHYHPQHNHHYSYRHGRFFRVSAIGRIAVAAPFGSIVLGLPLGHRSIMCGRDNYYYYDGIYYRPHTNGYIVVEAPRVRYVPYGARRIVVNDEVYFVQNNTWYCHRNGEYEYCAPPTEIQPESSEEAAKTTIMIENGNGSRTPVELEPLGANQWKGPRGEIYDGLPTDEQLKEGYGF